MEYLLVNDYSMGAYDHTIDDVKNSIEIELANMKGKGKKKAR